MTKTCSRCKLVKDESEFRKKKGNKLQPYCIECNREYQREHYKSNKATYRKQLKKARECYREWWLNLKSDLKCERCGEYHISTLDFHHKDPKEKDFSLADAIHRGLGKERVLAEIKKCEVLCSNCHRKEHWEDNNGAVV